MADPMRWAAGLTAFAACGMGFAALGVFGLMAYTVRQRRRELPHFNVRHMRQGIKRVVNGFVPGSEV